MTDWCSSEICGLLHWGVSMSDIIEMILCTKARGGRDMIPEVGWVFVHGESHAQNRRGGHLPLRLRKGKFGLVKRL